MERRAGLQRHDHVKEATVMKQRIPTSSRPLAAALGLCVLASAVVANAETSRQGFYIGVEVGVANASDMNSIMSGINHPTQCDQVLRNVDPTNVVDLTDPACQVGDTPTTMSQNSFDPGTGFLGGVSVGYALDRFRVEFEYLNRSHDGDASLWPLPAENTALQSKNSELSTSNPPLERVSDFMAHQFFMNAYYDFLNGSRWTPYLGAGVGLARTSLRYNNHFVRKTIAQGYPDDKPPAAAGTISFLDTGISETLFGFQFLGGLDYALTDRVSIGVKGRWAMFEEMSHSSVWNLIRSHEPVQADGQTPFTTNLAFDNIEYWAFSLGLKYSF